MKTKGETRASDVHTRMRADILSCELKPGDKLRFEALKDRYDVSFSTLREALARLSAESLVVSEGQRGFVVAPVSIADLKDLTNARVLLEREVLRLSMEYGDDKWEADILASYHRMDRLQTRLGAHYYFDEEWARLHGAFHRSLVCACKSPVLLDMRLHLFDRANRYRRMSSQFRTKWRPKDVEHKAIMDATLDREPEALDLIGRHIRETTENVIEFAGHLFVQDEVTASVV
ncbi:GntR family transcriptional regulator [Thalassospira lucentensis]|uniref:GntR family transcriptional regulator n=1 Tax=Thalassospira lucentensis TaxID=168935 RepID=UPI0003B649FB|nr:GntR family transcriptional regulator [Thalassospira lucentensis]RCK21747.1 GntR family transcriptional regulator [Thalassospira lucentensis MCCC 1A00383 = DSM 14000]